MGRSIFDEFKIAQLSSYIYVDESVATSLYKEIGQEGFPIDSVAGSVRGILISNQKPGMDISNVLNYYDDVVLEIASLIIRENMHLLSETISEEQHEALGIEFDKLKKEREKEEKVIFKEPKKITITRGGVEYEATQKTAWSKKEEAFVKSRKDVSTTELQSQFTEHFGLKRSTGSIRMKRYRLGKL